MRTYYGSPQRGLSVVGQVLVIAVVAAGLLMLLSALRPSRLPPVPPGGSPPPPSLQKPDPGSVPPPPLREYRYEVIEAPSESPGLWCRSGDPGCAAQHPWWVLWNDHQQDQLVQYRFLPPGFVTEGRFAEAIALLWRYQEGQFLLREAGERGVYVLSAPGQLLPNAYADYGPFAPRADRIRFHERYVRSSTWMVADILLHELQHLYDLRSGRQVGNCFSNAYQAERRFLRWLADWMGGLPSVSMVAGQLSPEDQEVFGQVQLSLSGTPQELNNHARVVHHTNCRW